MARLKNNEISVLAFKVPEQYAGKLARTVLRGQLPGSIIIREHSTTRFLIKII